MTNMEQATAALESAGADAGTIGIVLLTILAGLAVVKIATGLIHSAR